MTCTIRTFRPSDLEPIVALLNAADQVDHCEDGTSIQEMHGFLTMPSLYPEENVFVAEEDDGRLVGYAVLRLEKDAAESSFRGWYQVHPIRRGRGLEERLLRQIYKRAEERLGECETELVDFGTHANGTELDRMAILKQFGMDQVREGWMMLRPTLDTLSEPQFPQGVRVRPYRRNQDDAPVHQADTEAFRDHWGHVDQPLETWQHYIAQVSIRSDLSIVAEDTSTGEVAGYCVVAVNENENKRVGVRRGWIDILGVRRPYRRRGLGTALLLAGLDNLRQAGLTQAALGCDSENQTGATRIYERVGFQVYKTRVILHKQMRGESAGVERERAEVTG